MGWRLSQVGYWKQREKKRKQGARGENGASSTDDGVETLGGTPELVSQKLVGLHVISLFSVSSAGMKLWEIQRKDGVEHGGSTCKVGWFY